MKIENEFMVALPTAEAWRVLLDVPAIVPCMPGAELLVDEGDNTYRGRVKAKLGPVAVEFQGRAQFVDIDESTHTVRMKASGNEVKGRGNAAAEVTFRLAPEGTGTRVDVVTDVNLAGAVAQYGRAQGVIAGVAQVLVNQFATNLRAHISADAAQASTAAGGATTSGATEAGPPAGHGGNAVAPAAAASVQGLSIISLLIAYIRSLFSKKSAS